MWKGVVLVGQGPVVEPTVGVVVGAVAATLVVAGVIVWQVVIVEPTDGVAVAATLVVAEVVAVLLLSVQPRL